MKELKKIAQKVLALLMDILVFTWQVVRKVALPNRSRKGNLLSSLLAFFVGLLERVASFEKSVLDRPVVFTHRYVKQGLIIAVGFLFLLSSFEWTIKPSADTSGNESSAMVIRASAADWFQTVETQRIYVPASMPAGQIIASCAPAKTFSFSLANGPVMARKWLRFGVFRI